MSGWNLLDDVVDERLVDLSNMRVVRAPRVDSKAVFASEEVFEEGPVWRFWRDIHHSLETDILVQPNRPTEAILIRRGSAKEIHGIP